MAMVAADLRPDWTRLITVRSSIFCKINDQSYANKFNLSLKRTTPSMGSLRAHHTFKFNHAMPNSNAYKKLGAGYFEGRYTSAAKAKQGDDDSSDVRKGAGSVRIGDRVVSYMFSAGASHSVINAQTAKELCLETKPTPPTHVTLNGSSCICNTKCVVKWHMGNKMFTWTFLVASLKWDMILGVDWMNHVTPLDLELGGDSMTISMPEGIKWWLK